MRFNRLFLFSLILSGLATSVQAQYTTKSTTSSGFTTKDTQVTTPQQSSEKQENSVNKQPIQQTRPIFRPRPKIQEENETQTATSPETANSNNENEDELPSFEALENKTANGQATVQQPAPPPPPPKGEIWFYITDFNYRDLTGRTMNCTWKLVVQNRTDTPIKKMKLEYTILGETSPVILNNIKPNGSLVSTRGLFSEKCPAMAKEKPKVEVISCEMGSAQGQDCKSYIVIK